MAVHIGVIISLNYHQCDEAGSKTPDEKNDIEGSGDYELEEGSANADSDEESDSLETDCGHDPVPGHIPGSSSGSIPGSVPGSGREPVAGEK